VQYRTLGRTGALVSAIGLGTTNFGGPTDAATADRILHSGLDAGINLVDTADVYQDGRSERAVGDALARSGRRDQVMIATKVGLAAGQGPNQAGGSRRHIVASCERSLRRLRTDRVDLYQLHRPCFDITLEETLGALDDLVRSGKIVYIGSSTHPAWYLMESLCVSRRNRWASYISEQAPYNLLDRRAENELLPFCRRHGLAVLAWSPLAAGILAGRYPSAGAVPTDSRAGRNPALRDRVSDTAVAVARRVSELAGEAGIAATDLALRWVHDQPDVTSMLVGPRTPEHLTAYLRATDQAALDPSLLAELDALVPPGSYASDFYNSSLWMPGSRRHRPIAT
jgi:aryl-alcohol dehydrogenase-like predicted oxidoreductase